MHQQVQDIVAVLREMIEAHKMLLELGRVKQAAIKDNDTETLSKVTLHEKKYVNKINELDKQRAQLVWDYLKLAGVRVFRFYKLEHLIQAVNNPDEKRKLLQTSAELIHVMDELKRLNDFNRELTRMQLHFANHLMDLLTGPAAEEVTYHRALQEQGYNPYNRFDTKA